MESLTNKQIQDYTLVIYSYHPPGYLPSVILNILIQHSIYRDLREGVSLYSCSNSLAARKNESRARELDLGCIVCII